ncbi:MAG TPA: tetratricopeptide repeat protein, partial [Gammaproteobacteria bacterium]|nr:tetratricopeptide repeat protein [Gammaproteobacteria bacterium]
MNATVPARLPSAAMRRMRSAAAAQQRRDYASAEALYRSLTREYPDFADAWHFYGLLLHQRGEGRQALAMLERAERLTSDNFPFLVNHGRVLLEIGEYRRAYAQLERARRHPAADPSALKLLIHAALKLGREAEMLPLLDEQLTGALARNAGDWQLWILLGECRERSGDRPGALAAFAEAGVFAPAGEVTPQLRQGSAALSAGQLEPARVAFEQALRRLPDSPEALLGLANVAAREGDFGACQRLARQALARNPRLYIGWLLRVDSLGNGSAEALAADMETAAKRAGEDPEAFPLHFARGQLREKLGDYETAFAAYELGNRQRGRSYPYQAAAQTAYSRDVIESLDEAFVARAPAVGVPGAGPIFVIGMPRSGTTLVETILAS